MSCLLYAAELPRRPVCTPLGCLGPHYAAWNSAHSKAEWPHHITSQRNAAACSLPWHGSNLQLLIKRGVKRRVMTEFCWNILPATTTWNTHMPQHSVLVDSPPHARHQQQSAPAGASCARLLKSQADTLSTTEATVQLAGWQPQFRPPAQCTAGSCSGTC